jgi:chemotaxis methyl-accepting protein methylase
MNIQSPPKPPPIQIAEVFHQKIADCISPFENHFKNASFEDRYFPKFDWFKSSLPRPEKVINLGCSRGRETFALMWNLKAMQAVGIDKDSDRIIQAKSYVSSVHRLAELVALIFQLTNFPPQYAEELRSWYENGVPSEIRERIVPGFIPGDISRTIRQFLGQFDLVYLRYVLHLIMDEDKNTIPSAIHNIASVVRPEVGRVVIIEPTEKEKDGNHHSYDFEPYFRTVGLEVIKRETDETRLGGLDDPNTKLKGYILYKPTDE